MKKLLFIISLFCSTLVHAQDYKLSKQIANNCMQKGNETFFSNPNSSKDIALFMDGFSELWKNTADVSYFNFIKNNIDKNILNNKGELLNVNNTISTIKIGETLLFLYRVTGEYKYFKATQSIINQIKTQTRNKEGVFINNNETELESLYITMPLYAEFAYILNDHTAFDDIANQYLATSNILLDPKTKLLNSIKEDNPKANFSPIKGEEIGKFEMSLIDVLDYFPSNHPKYSELIELYKKYAFVIRDVKNETFSSTSCNSMFAYSIAKGVKRKILPTSSSELAKKLFEKSINNQVNNDLSQQGYLLKASNEIETIPTLSIGNGKTVLLDHFFNHETMKDSTGHTFPHHYLWNQEEQNGYSLFGHVFNKYGVKTLQDSTEINESILKNADIYIIVDPDNKKEIPNPKFINSKHIDLIVNWVKQGGVLLLFANDSSNTELKGLNELASNFGIHFNDKIRNKVAGKQFEQGAIHISENHPVFTNIKKLFLKGICTISCTSPAEAIVTEENDTIMAISKLGKGYVFAVGDPWLYNEYANGRNISSEFENYKAMEALVKWAIKQSSH